MNAGRLLLNYRSAFAENVTDRSSWRVTAFYDLDFKREVPKLGWLGRHVFTAAGDDAPALVAESLHGGVADPAAGAGQDHGLAVVGHGRQCSRTRRDCHARKSARKSGVPDVPIYETGRGAATLLPAPPWGWLWTKWRRINLSLAAWARSFRRRASAISSRMMRRIIGTPFGE